MALELLQIFIYCFTGQQKMAGYRTLAVAFEAELDQTANDKHRFGMVSHSLQLVSRV